MYKCIPSSCMTAVLAFMTHGVCMYVHLCIYRAALMWDTPADTAARLYEWAKQNNQIGGVVTVYELHQGEVSVCVLLAILHIDLD